MAALQKQGRYVLVGLGGGNLNLILPQVALRAISLCGVSMGSEADTRAVLDYYKSGRLSVRTETFPLASANEAMDTLRSGQAPGRIILLP